MCQHVRIIPQPTVDENRSKESLVLYGTNTEQESFDEQYKILCNVIVRATHDLHINQQKSQNEIETFLKNDCRQLSSFELMLKVEETNSRQIDNYFVFR